MWSQGESNPRPSECHSDALPTELWPRNAYANISNYVSKQKVYCSEKFEHSILLKLYFIVIKKIKMSLLKFKFKL